MNNEIVMPQVKKAVTYNDIYCNIFEFKGWKIIFDFSHSSTRIEYIDLNI